MTATETTFLEDLADAQVTFADVMADRLLLSDPDLLSMGKVKVTLLTSMIEIINYWFRDTTSGDDNFFTTDEIQDVIDHANKIMGTTLYIDLSSY